MTQTSTVSSAQASQTSPLQSQGGSQNTAKINSEFETFLKMLTVQMKNQDPLNPIESADYAVQLATFSGVEQQVKTNELLKSISGGLKADGLSALSGWIGREVPAAGRVGFSGQPLSLVIDRPAEATRTQIEVYDSGENVVQRLTVPSDATRYEWRGLSANGAQLPAGTYRFRTIHWKDNQPLAQSATPVFQRITEVRNSAQGGELILAGGQTVKANDVTALRQARR